MLLYWLVWGEEGEEEDEDDCAAAACRLSCTANSAGEREWNSVLSTFKSTDSSENKLLFAIHSIVASWRRLLSSDNPPSGSIVVSLCTFLLAAASASSTGIP